ncbi:MAG: ABC transporter permease [Verrucomicrobiota bacterium]
MSGRDSDLSWKERAHDLIRYNRLFVVGLLITALFLLLALAAPILTPQDPLEIDFETKLEAPGIEHWFGTDVLGRDIFSRVVYATRTSLLTGVMVVTMALLIGLPIGLIAGYYGGRIDNFLMRIADVFLAFPPLLLPIAITAALGPGLYNALMALAISWFPWYARILRASVISVKEELYVKSSQAMGMNPLRIMLRHALPNSTTPVIVQASMDFGYTILAAASLSFIGMGARPPTLEWGLMISNSRAIFLEYWWTAFFPGAAIFLLVLGVNLLGDGIRDILDPNYSDKR